MNNIFNYGIIIKIGARKEKKRTSVKKVVWEVDFEELTF